MESVKRKIILFWLTHIFLRRIGKRYPEYFKQWTKDLTDDNTARLIMLLRYTGDEQMKFAGDIMKDLAKMDKSLAKACYYDSKRDDVDDKAY